MRLKHSFSRFHGVGKCELVLLVVLSLIGHTSLEGNMEVEKLSSSIARFSAQFCKEVIAEESSVSSPLSAELVLALLALGAGGVSHDQILASLHIPDDDFVRSGFTAISAKLSSIKGVTFNIANKLYLKEGPYELKPRFKSDAVQVFAAEVEKINFDNGAAAANTINKWVEGKTNDRIKNLLSPDSLGTDTRVVLVNALYFKGTWKDRFDPHLTRDLPFHVNTKQTINIPFMSIEKKFMYGESEELDAKLLEMPYEGEEASLLVVLPNAVDGLDALLGKLAAGADLDAATRSMFHTKVQVRLPKFKIETKIDLKDLLPKLGIKAIFEPMQCDLSGVLDKEEPLYVSQAVQKAFIEVNEEGAEAAAASAFGIMATSAMVELDPVTFVADRPFIAAVRTSSTLAFWALVRFQQ